MSKKKKALTAQELIKTWGLSKRVIAEKMGANFYTFKMKLLERPNYKFTDDEKEKLINVLMELASDITSCTQ